MDTIESAAAELGRLRDTILDQSYRDAAKGFTMASDTQLRLAKAEAMIAQAGSQIGDVDSTTTAAQEWIAEATALAALLRAEAGQVE